MAHKRTRVSRVDNSYQYHNRSYSVQMICPCCLMRKRFNTNFLGNRTELYCSGTKTFEKVKDVPIHRFSVTPVYKG